MNFSIMFPTNRPCYLPFTINSIISNTSDLKNIEIRLGVDNEDIQTQKIALDLQKKYPSVIHIHLRDRTPNLVKGYFNWLSMNFCEGKYVLVINDDSLFACKDWDIKAFKKLEKYLEDKLDGIVYGLTEDGEDKRTRIHLSHPTTDFPIISKKGIEHLGYFFNPKFISSGADPDIAKTYYNMGRIVDLTEEVIVIHKPKELISLEKER